MSIVGADLIVNHEALDSITIPNMERTSNDIGEVYNEMLKVVGSLNQYIEGQTADEYYNEFTKLIGPSIQSIQQLISDYKSQLQSISASFAEMDASGASSIRIG